MTPSTSVPYFYSNSGFSYESLTLWKVMTAIMENIETADTINIATDKIELKDSIGLSNLNYLRVLGLNFHWMKPLHHDPITK